MDTLLNKPVRPFEIFHEKTKQNATRPSPYPAQAGNRNHTRYKGYPRFERILLPEPRPLPKSTLQEALAQRVSGRRFGSRPLPLDGLSSLLYFSAGLRSMGGFGNGRFYPSAGARYPIEVYIIARRITQIQNGLYHYYLKNHSLELIRKQEDIDIADYFNQPWLKECGGIIILSARFDRTVSKYGDRGYRYILMECGHLMQNVHLVAQTLRLSSCAVGGFTDDRLNALLDLVPSAKEKTIYAAGIGCKPRLVANGKM